MDRPRGEIPPWAAIPHTSCLLRASISSSDCPFRLSCTFPSRPLDGPSDLIDRLAPVHSPKAVPSFKDLETDRHVLHKEPARPYFYQRISSLSSSTFQPSTSTITSPLSLDHQPSQTLAITSTSSSQCQSRSSPVPKQPTQSNKLAVREHGFPPRRRRHERYVPVSSCSLTSSSLSLLGYIFSLLPPLGLQHKMLSDASYLAAAHPSLDIQSLFECNTQP